MNYIKHFIFLCLCKGIIASAFEKSIIHKIDSEDAPQPYGAYSQAISVDLQLVKNLVFVSGQVAIHPKTGELQEGNIAIATKQTMDNVEAILKAAGSDWPYVVRMDVFLRDIDKDWQGMDQEYAKRFKHGVPPARQTVGVSMSNRIEISCIAIVPQARKNIQPLSNLERGSLKENKQSNDLSDCL